MDTWHILVTIGVGAFIIEIFTVGFIAGSIGIGLLLASVGNYIGLEIHWQILIFSFGVVSTYFLIKPIITKYGYKKNPIKTNQSALIERSGIVTQEINPAKNTGRVKIDGDDWKADAKNNDIIKIGTAVKVVAIDSIILVVEPLN